MKYMKRPPRKSDRQNPNKNKIKGDYITIPRNARFGLWRVIEFSGRRGKHILYLCECIGCGTHKNVMLDHLRSGNSSGCQKCRRSNDSSKVQFTDQKRQVFTIDPD